ncbi:hypothetical protein [Streptomyces sp. NPDC057557]|uniref:hypothetical protein n=1 Tax=Streptomyces sp. NPDC057557 TaxID=3346167 RepID=UPI0036C5B7B9
MTPTTRDVEYGSSLYVLSSNSSAWVTNSQMKKLMIATPKTMPMDPMMIPASA